MRRFAFLLGFAIGCGRSDLDPSWAIPPAGDAARVDTVDAGDTRRASDAACRWGLAPRVRTPTDFPLFVHGAGDFDGDGHLDLAYSADPSDGNPGTVGVMFGRGDGTFAHPLSLPAGHSPTVGTGDFNGDGQRDLVSTNYSDDTVSIYLNRGDGTFAPQATYESELCGFGTAVGDLDGDGIDDLAVAHYCADGVTSVLLNRGDGTFAPPAHYATGDQSDDVTLGDFDGDGRNDLAVSAFLGDVTVLHNAGDGTFSAPPASYGAGKSPNGIARADVDGDGAPDLVVVSAHDSALNVLVNRGDGTFAAKVSYPIGLWPSRPVVADLNGDGSPDVAVIQIDSSIPTPPGTLTIFINAGDGTFLPAVTLDAGMGSWHMVAGDFDGDGHVDLVVSSAFDQSLNVFWARCD
jgi:hypothetical protein